MTIVDSHFDKQSNTPFSEYYMNKFINNHINDISKLFTENDLLSKIGTDTFVYFMEVNFQKGKENMFCIRSWFRSEIHKLNYTHKFIERYGSIPYLERK